MRSKELYNRFMDLFRSKTSTYAKVKQEQELNYFHGHSQDMFTNQKEQQRRQDSYLTPNILKLFLVSICTLLTAYLLIAGGENQKQIKGVTAIFGSSGRYDLLEVTLDSFFEMNTYPLQQIIVVEDGFSNPSLSKTMNKYTNITWIITEQKIGQIAAIDLAYKRINSEYYFHSENDWEFIKKGFIQYSLQVMEKNPIISQVAIKPYEGIESQNVSLMDSVYSGFSFNPALHRLRDYKLFQGGYANATKNISYGRGAGHGQKYLSMLHLEMGFRIFAASQPYIQHLGSQRSSPKFKQTDQIQYKPQSQFSSQQKNLCQFTSRVSHFQKKRIRIMKHRKKQLSEMFKLTSQYQQSKPSIFGIQYKQLGVNSNIQLATQLDYIKIQSSPFFKQFKQDFQRVFQTWFRFYGKQNQTDRTLITYAEFKNSSQIEEYLKNFQVNNEQNVKIVSQQRSEQFNLARILLTNENDPKSLEAEFYFYDKKYKISKLSNQISICIFVQGQSISSKGKYQQLFASIQNQNYSNYKLVFVDDGSIDNSHEKIYQFIDKNLGKVKNRVVAISRNVESLGTAANMYLRAKKFCRRQDVIINLNANSKLLGRQAFNVINAVYQKNLTWVSTFRSIKKQKCSSTKYCLSPTPNISINSNLRTQDKELTPYLKTFIYELNLKVPIQYLTQFVYDNITSYFKPMFYDTHSENFQFYSFVEMSGNSRSKSVDSILYAFDYYIPKENCAWAGEQYTNIKAKLKKPLKQLKSIEQKVQVQTNSKLSLSITKQLKRAYQKYSGCIKQSKSINYGNKISQQKLHNILETCLRSIKEPQKYIKLSDNIPNSQLPFCLIYKQREQLNTNRKKIIQSILAQQYRNFIVINIPLEGSKNSDQTQYFQQSFKSKVRESRNHFASYQDIINATSLCPTNSILMRLTKPLKKSTLQQLNRKYQNLNIWLTYTQTNSSVQIDSFYLRVLELLKTNDFSNTNQAYFNKGDHQLIAISLLQLCSTHAYKQMQQIPSQEEQRTSIIHQFKIHKNSDAIYFRMAYHLLISLSHDFYQPRRWQNYQSFMAGTAKKYIPLEKTMITQEDMLKAIQYQQIPYLPSNHSLNERELYELNRSYGVKRMNQKQGRNELRMCVVVIAHNTITNQLYKKNIKSLIQQNYTNYHIVYIDDSSDDSSLNKSMEEFEKHKFPPQRITFIQNIQRMHLLYNIANSAFNLCGSQEIQIIINGNDELIGRHVFSLINQVYQQNSDLWVVYTNFRTNYFTYGANIQVKALYEFQSCNSKKTQSFMDGLASWRVSLIRKIPFQNYQNQFGGWLDIQSNFGIQYPLLQMASPARIKYIPYIAYEKHQMDPRSKQARQMAQHEKLVKSYTITKKPLQILSSLSSRELNQIPFSNNENYRVVQWKYGD